MSDIADLLSIRSSDERASIWVRAIIWTVSILLLLQLVAWIVPIISAASTRDSPLTAFLFVRQDSAILVAITILWILGRAIPPKSNDLFQKIGILSEKRFVILGIMPAILFIGWVGRWVIFQNYDLSRDEKMATFDAYIFAHGRLIWPIPDQWRPFASALNQLFILPIGQHEAWVSNYLPINAAVRALLGSIIPVDLVSPLFVTAGVLALWRINLILWPEQRSSRIVTLCLYACSAQIILTSMTSYAMSGHLALNLIWLLLFLINRPLTHGLAMGVGFLAVGLHQPIFHPLFVAPFLLMLWQQGRWRLLFSYVIAYAAIGSFWLLWPIWISALATGPALPHGPEQLSYFDRLLAIVHFPNISAFWLMAVNLLRFASFQHLAFLPLVIAGIIMSWRSDPIVRALSIGLVLPIIVSLILLPYQGHGWGYRYLHGVIGNTALLGGYGWNALKMREAAPERLFAWLTVASLAILLPVRAVMAHAQVHPYADVDAMIKNSRAKIAVVDDRFLLFSEDLVINRPDLSNRPIRLKASALSKPMLRNFCNRQDVLIVEEQSMSPILIYSGIKQNQNTLCKSSKHQNL